MPLLKVKDRQRCLKALGFYDGAVDGLEGRQTSKAYADLQAKYFIKPDDVVVYKLIGSEINGC